MSQRHGKTQSQSWTYAILYVESRNVFCVFYNDFCLVFTFQVFLVNNFVIQITAVFVCGFWFVFLGYPTVYRVYCIIAALQWSVVFAIYSSISTIRSEFRSSARPAYWLYLGRRLDTLDSVSPVWVKKRVVRCELPHSNISFKSCSLSSIVAV